MVIQCSACNTRFKIADDKLKPGGVKVRCSKCQEIFTVTPPEEEPVPAPEPQPETEDTGSDWSDLNTSGEDSATDEESGADWSDFGGDSDTGGAGDGEVGEEAPSFDDFSFGDDTAEEEPAEESFTFGGTETDETAADDDFALGDDTDQEESADSFDFGDAPDTAEQESVGISEDAFAFGGSAVDEPQESLGEGAQDEFAFDDNGNIDLGDETSSDDFDWGDSSGSADDSLATSSGPSGGSDDLDFSSISLQDDTPEPPAASAPAPAAPAPSTPPKGGTKRPASVKGPQKGKAGKKRPAKGRHSKKKKGPWGTLLALILLLSLLIGGGLYGMQQLGYWNGDFTQLGSADYVGFGKDLWTRAEAKVQQLINNRPSEPAGSIAVTEMSARFLDNRTAGRLFIIEGKIRNDFTTPRSAIAVRGILYDAAGKAIAQQKAFCGNMLSNKELASMPMAKILEHINKPTGDLFSNSNIPAQGSLSFLIVFSNLPPNIVEYNVESAESSPGS